jgi:hypothetical protein
MPTVVFYSKSSYKVNNSSYHKPIYGNYKFDTELTYFGVMKERKFRKVNRIQSLLKLREVKDSKSIYPMLDEFGYSFLDFFIFKSTWDYGYSIETVLPKPNPVKDINNVKVTKDKFFSESITNVGRMIQNWEEDLGFTAGRPVFINNNNFE